jgi:hypothetical protein
VAAPTGVLARWSSRLGALWATALLSAARMSDWALE